MSELLETRLATLPRFYTYKDVLEVGFAGNEDAFTLAYCDGSLPPEMRQVVLDTAGVALVTVWLLRLLVRQQAQMLQAWGGGEETP
jgi:hypothetical protein